MKAILAEAQTHTRGELVFPTPKKRQPLSESAFKVLLDRMQFGEITPHGFRSSFRDWVSETTDFSREVAEMALAHVIEDKTEAAYRRRDLFDKRRELMAAWEGYCCPRPASTTPLAVRHDARSINTAEAVGGAS
ncbi:MAG: hypothetical protein WAU68_12280 [Vitreimonas sp.]